MTMLESQKEVYKLRPQPVLGGLCLCIAMACRASSYPGTGKAEGHVRRLWDMISTIKGTNVLEVCMQAPQATSPNIGSTSSNSAVGLGTFSGHGLKFCN